MKKSDVKVGEFYTVKATDEKVRVAEATEKGFKVWTDNGQQPFEVTARELA